MAFLISTPESGVDSIALTYSLLDPVMTVIRPLTAFFTATIAGIAENLFGGSYSQSVAVKPDLSCTVDGCCDGVDCDPKVHARHHTFMEKLRAGAMFAFDELMSDLATWFMLGILLAGVITALVPESFIAGNFGSGLFAYLGMLVVSLPMYVCATMSTPIAAALVMKGMSPGAALVLLMAGPATNMATLTTVAGILGRRTLAIYLFAIVTCTLVFAFITDAIYAGFGISAQAAAIVDSGEFLPAWVETGSAFILAALILRVIWQRAAALFSEKPVTGAHSHDHDHDHGHCSGSSHCHSAAETGDT